jgi:hypothetical protein
MLVLVARHYFLFTQGALNLFLRASSIAVGIVAFILAGQLALRLFTTFF